MKKRGRPKKQVYIKAQLESGKTIFANNVHVSNYGPLTIDILVKGPEPKILPHVEYVEDDEQPENKEPSET